MIYIYLYISVFKTNVSYVNKCLDNLNSCRSTPSKIASGSTIFIFGFCLIDLEYLLFCSGDAMTTKVPSEFFPEILDTHFPPHASIAPKIKRICCIEI